MPKPIKTKKLKDVLPVRKITDDKIVERLDDVQNRLKAMLADVARLTFDVLRRQNYTDDIPF